MGKVPFHILYKDFLLLLAVICILIAVQICLARRAGAYWKGFIIPAVYSVYSISYIWWAKYLELNSIRHRRDYLASATYFFPGILLLMVYFIFYYYYQCKKQQ